MKDGWKIVICGTKAEMEAEHNNLC